MSRFTNNIKYYSIGVISTKILSFLIVPLYSLYVETEALGTFQYLTSLIMLAVPLLYQSIWEGMFRFSIIEEKDCRNVIRTVTNYCLVITLVYIPTFVFISYIFGINHYIYILAYGVIIAASSYWQFAARSLKENKYYMYSTIICSFLTIVLNVLFVVILRWQLKGLFISIISGNFFSVIYLEAKIRILKDVSFKDYNSAKLKEIIKYSIPLAVNSISWWLINSCNNVIVTKMISANANGILAMSQRFGSVFVLFTTIISMAWQEESFRTVSKHNRDDKFNNVLSIYYRFLFTGVACLIPVTYIFYRVAIFGDYYSGVHLTSLLYVIGVFNAVNTHLGSAFLASGESNVLFWTTLSCGVLSTILAVLFLLMDAHIYYVLIASLLSCIFNYYIRILLLKKRIKIVVNQPLFIGLFVYTMGISVFCYLAQNNLVYQVCILVLTLPLLLRYNKEMLNRIKIKFIARR